MTTFPVSLPEVFAEVENADLNVELAQLLIAQRPYLLSLSTRLLLSRLPRLILKSIKVRKPKSPEDLPVSLLGLELSPKCRQRTCNQHRPHHCRHPAAGISTLQEIRLMTLFPLHCERTAHLASLHHRMPRQAAKKSCCASRSRSQVSNRLYRLSKSPPTPIWQM